MKDGPCDRNNIFEGAVEVCLAENTLFGDSIFNEECRNELKEINKHEIIIKICELLGPDPANLCKAEEMFEIIKYDIANYIIHHEYNSPRGISTDLLLWLDGKSNPTHIQKLNDFISKLFR